MFDWWPSEMNVSWPKISIVTPSFNQGEYLEEAIRSVIRQGYPNLEYFVVDGGSTDDSAKIIQGYADSINWWVSQKDRGQTDALIKGFSRASGDLLGWINSDDLLEPGALAAVAQAYRDNPGSLIAGSVVLFSHSSRRERLLRPKNLNFGDMIRIWERKFFFSQPGVFFPRQGYVQSGGLDENLSYCMDLDLMIRLSRLCPVIYLDEVLARARQHPASKTCSQSGDMVAESCAVARRYLTEAGGPNRAAARWQLKAYTARRILARVYHGAPGAVWPLLKELARPREIPPRAVSDNHRDLHVMPGACGGTKTFVPSGAPVSRWQRTRSAGNR